MQTDNAALSDDSDASLSARALTLFGDSAFNPAIGDEILQPYWLLLLPLLFQQLLLRVYSRWRFGVWMLPLEMFYMVKAKLRLSAWIIPAEHRLRTLMHEARTRAQALLVSRQAARAMHIAEPHEHEAKSAELRQLLQDSPPDLLDAWGAWEDRWDAVRAEYVLADVALLQRSFAFTKLDLLFVLCSAAQLALQLYSTFAPSSPHRCTAGSHWLCYELLGFRLFNFLVPSSAGTAFLLSEKMFRAALISERPLITLKMVRKMSEPQHAEQGQQGQGEEEAGDAALHVPKPADSHMLALNLNSPLLADDRAPLPTSFIQGWSNVSADSSSLPSSASADPIPSLWSAPLLHRDSVLPICSMLLLLPTVPYLFTNIIPIVAAYAWLLALPLLGLDRLADTVKVGGGMDRAECEWQQDAAWSPLTSSQQQQILRRALVYIVSFTNLASVLVPLLAALTYNYSQFLFWGENFFSVLFAEWRIHSTSLYFQSLQASSERLWRCILQI